MDTNKIYQGSALEVLKTFPSESIDMCITSPPYWGLRDYGVPGQLGLEPTFHEYINNLCNIFDEVKQVLKTEGTCWVNLGDTYGGSGGAGGDYNKGGLKEGQPKYKGNKAQAKSLCQIPSRFAIEMSNRGWILRNELIWYKPNCMPSSVTDRFTVDFEKIFFFTKNKKYYFEQQFEPFAESTLKGSPTRNRKNGSAFVNGTPGRGKQSGGKIVMPNSKGRNKRCIWRIPPKAYKEAHFAVYPEKLIEIPIKAGCPAHGVILDPFLGSGTTAVVALKLNRNYVGIELNEEYIKLAERRLCEEENAEV